MVRKKLKTNRRIEKKMSMYDRFKTWEDLIEYLKGENDYRCFMVNYLPDNDEYALWIGSQPYTTYEKWIEELEEEKRVLKERIRKLEEENRELKDKKRKERG